MTKYNALRAASLKSLDTGKHCDGRGLWLYKRADGGAQWVFRFTLHGRQRDTGLGSLKSRTLAEAREVG